MSQLEKEEEEENSLLDADVSTEPTDLDDTPSSTLHSIGEKRENEKQFPSVEENLRA